MGNHSKYPYFNRAGTYLFPVSLLGRPIRLLYYQEDQDAIHCLEKLVRRPFLGSRRNQHIHKPYA